MSTLSRQGSSTSKPYSLARDNQLRDQLEGAFQALTGCGIAAGGAITLTTGYSAQIAAGTTIFAKGVSLTLASAQAFTVAYPSTTRYVWGKLTRTAANQDSATALDTYALVVSSTPTNVAPSDEHFELGTAVTNGSGLVSISDPAGKYVGVLGQAEFVLRDGSRSFTDDVDAGGNRVINAADPEDPQDLTTMIWVETQIEAAVGDGADLTAYLKRDGTNAMAAALDMGTHKIAALSPGTLSTDGGTVGQIATAKSEAISTAATATSDLFKKDGSRNAAGNFNMAGYDIENLPNSPSALHCGVNGNWVLAQLAGFSTANTKVRTDAGDTTEGYLADKITSSRGLLVTQTGPGSGDRKENIALDTRAEALPAYSVTILPGESVVLAIDFTTRGSFPNADLYTVSAYFDNITSGSLGHINDWATIRELPGHFGDALQGTAITPKTGTRCLLEITNHSPDLVAAFDESSHNFRIFPTLTGCGWVAGASPSGTPTVTVYRYTSRTVLEFELDPLTIPKGTKGLVEIDFSGLGRYSGQYLVQAEPANADATVVALCSGRTHSSCQLEVSNAASAASTSVTLTVTLQGERYLAASHTLNPDTPGDPSATVLTTTSAQEQISIATFGGDEPASGWGTVLRYPCHKAITIGSTALLAISRAHCETRPSSSAEFEIYDFELGVGQTLIGLQTFSSASNLGAFDFATYGGEVTVDAGHVIKIVAGAGAEAPLADWCINLIGLIDRD